MASFFSLVTELETLLGQLNIILAGAEDETVEVNGVTKDSISKAIRDKFSAIQAMVNGRLNFETKSALVSSGAPANSELAEVWNDPVDLNNGLYGYKDGNWVKSKYDVINELGRIKAMTSKPWLSLTTGHFESYQNASDIVNAVHAVRAVGVPKDRVYRVAVVCNNDSNYSDRFYLRDNSNKLWRLPAEVIDETKKASGPIWIKLTSNSEFGYFEVLIDYRGLPEGTLLNTTENRLVINQSVIAESDNQAARNKQSSSISVFNENKDLDFYLSSTNLEILNAFKGIFFENADSSRKYRLVTLCCNDETFNDNITIKDDQNRAYSFSGVVSNKNAQGLTEIQLNGSDGKSIKVYIDYNKFSVNKVYWNTDDSTWTFSGYESVGEATRLLAMSDQFPFFDVQRSMIKNSAVKELGKAIKGFRYLKGDPNKPLGIQILAVDDDLYNYNIWLTDGTKSVCVNANSDGRITPNPSGYTRIIVKESSGSGFEVELYIDYREISSKGILLNNPPDNAQLWLKPGNQGQGLDYQKLDEHILQYHFSPWLLGDASNAEIRPYLNIVKAISGIYLEGKTVNTVYEFGILTKNDPVFKTRCAIFSNGSQIAIGQVETANTDGLTEIEFTSGLRGSVWIDFRGLSDGILVNKSNSPLKIDPSYIDPRALLKVDNKAVISNEPYPVNLRVSVAGSSITWGSGYIGQNSYVGVIEKHLRTQLATTLMPSELTASSPAEEFTLEKMCYQGKLYKFSGVDTLISGELQGDEISIAVAKERGNKGAAIIELLVDGAIWDTFSTYNDEPFFTDLTISETGDGSVTYFDLGLAHTFDHVVKVNGEIKTGKIANGGYGGSFGDNDEWLVIRKVVEINGNYEVRHFLRFKTAPASGANIVCQYSAGESIKPGRSTVANMQQYIGSTLESSYGDGDVAYDPANPKGFSSGLDFRQTDERAIHTWRFASSENRKFSFRIKSIDPRATGVTPELFINYVTNRIHYIQNAGIGGFKASSFLPTEQLRSYRQINSFKPDVVILESCTNDDWDTNEWLAHVEHINQTAEQVRDIDSSYNIVSLSGSGNDYTVQSTHIPIESVSPFSVQFSQGGSYLDISQGDLIVFGDFKGDNRRVAVRVIDSWDDVTKTATFESELLDTDLIHIDSIDYLVGSTAQIKRVSAWENNVTNVLNKLKIANPQLKLCIATSGIPNLYARRLEGYREKAQHLAAALNVEFVDYYKATFQWTYDQQSPRQAYIGVPGQITADGSSEYPLFLSDNTPLQEYLPRNFSVKVNGIERLNDGCCIKGGQKKGWPLNVEPMTLNNHEWLTEQSVLIFTNNIPQAGDDIIVSYNPYKWSNDDCHPGSVGYELLGKAVVNVLRRII